MSNLELSLISFLCGWLLCNLLLLVRAPSLKRKDAALEQHQGIFYYIGSKYRIIAALPTESTPTEETLQEDRRLKIIKAFLAFLLLVTSTLIVSAIFLQGFDVPLAFRIEETVADRRVSAIAAFVLLGFACRAYRFQIFGALNALSFIALEPSKAARKVDSTNPTGTTKSQGPTANQQSAYADLSFPWFVQVGALVSIVALSILAFNPEFLKGLTSLKAGSLEAHFGGGSGASTLASGQVTSLGPNVKATVRSWSRFCYPTNNKDDTRFFTYHINKIDESELQDSNMFFTIYLKSVFQEIRDLDDIDTSQNDLKKNGDETESSCIVDVFLPEKHSGSGFNSMQIELLGLVKTYSLKLADSIIHTKTATSTDQSKSNIDRERSFNEIFCLYERIKHLRYKKAGLSQADSTKSATNTATQTPSQCEYTIQDDFFTQKKPDLQKEPDLSRLDKAVLDPFVINAVSDLLYVSSGPLDQEAFLAAVSEAHQVDPACSNGCKIPIAGQISLNLAEVEAKVRSTRPWPMEETISQLRATLKGINAVLDAIEASKTNVNAESRASADTESRYRANRLFGLSLGLKLFGQRLLIGQRLTSEQQQIWRDWLAEAREAFSLAEDLGSLLPAQMDGSTRASWRNAKKDVDDADIRQPAAINIALSLVLIEGNTVDPSTAECAAARSTFGFAKSDSERYFKDLNLAADEKATYKGFLEQVGSQITGRCARS